MSQIVCGARPSSISTHLALIPTVGLSAPAQEASLVAYVDKVRDQLGERCTGEAFGAGLHVAGGGKGPHPSAFGIWTLAKVRERARRGVPLTDVPVDPNDCIAGMLESGVYPEDEAEEADPKAYSRAEYWDEIQNSVRLTQDHFAAIPFATRSADMRRAISAGWPVAFAMWVDKSYFDYTAGIWTGMTGARAGGHMQLAVGYDAESFLVLNSWGTSFGLRGYSRIANSYFDSFDVFDATAVRKGVDFS